MTDTVRVGVIGAGYWGQKHIEELDRLSGADLAVVCDTDPKALLDVDDDVYGGRLSTDIRDVYDVDAAVVATPNTTHHEVAADLLATSIHTLVEKPLATSSVGAWDLVTRAELADVSLMPGHIYRYCNAVDRVKEMIDDGLVGEVRILRARWTNHEEPFTDRTLWDDLLPHPFDIFHNLLGKWPDHVVAAGTGWRTGGPEAGAVLARYSLPRPVHAEVQVSWVDRSKYRRVEVVGSEGSIVADVVNSGLFYHPAGEAEQDWAVEPNNTLRDELKAFLDSVRGDRPRFTGVVGAECVDVINAARSSTGRLMGVTLPKR